MKKIKWMKEEILKIDIFRLQKRLESTYDVVNSTPVLTQ